MHEEQTEGHGSQTGSYKILCPQEISKISKLRVHYSHKQQPCVQALAFTRQLHVVSQTFQAKDIGKASSAFKYQYPQFLLKATSPAKEASLENILPSNNTRVTVSWQTIGNTLQQYGPDTVHIPHWRANCLLEKYSATPYFIRKQVKVCNRVKHFNFTS